MSLSPLAAHFAAEIASHDWSDAPYRVDRAGHRREHDTNRGAQVLSPDETNCVRTNAMWVAAQVLAHQDPAFDVHEFAEACGIDRRMRLRSNGTPSGGITAGLRTISGSAVRYAMPGSPMAPSVIVDTTHVGADAAITGDVRIREDSPSFTASQAALIPRAHVLTMSKGLVYGAGFIDKVDVRGSWHVVRWDSFVTTHRPYPVHHGGTPIVTLDRPVA